MVWQSLSTVTQEHLSIHWSKLKEALATYQTNPAKPLLILLCGGTNTGKSTLFNLILNEEVSPTRIIAGATKQPMVFLPSHFLESPYTQQLCDMSHLAVKEDVLSSPTSLNAMQIYLYTQAIPRSLLNSVDPRGYIGLIDTPDHDSSDVMNHQIARRMIDFSDLCIYTTTAQKYKMASTMDMLKELLNRRIRIGVIFNRLEVSQDLEEMWQDLTKIIETSDQVHIDQPLNYIQLLGGLPFRADPTKSSDLQERMNVYIHTLLNNKSPQHYLLDHSAHFIRLRQQQLHQSIAHLQDQRDKSLQTVHSQFEQRLAQDHIKPQTGVHQDIFQHIQKALKQQHIEAIFNRSWLRRISRSSYFEIQFSHSSHVRVGLEKWEELVLKFAYISYQNLIGMTQSKALELSPGFERLNDGVSLADREEKWSKTVYLQVWNSLDGDFKMSLEDLDTLNEIIRQSDHRLEYHLKQELLSYPKWTLELLTILTVAISISLGCQLMTTLLSAMILSFLLTFITILRWFRQSLSSDFIQVKSLYIFHILLEQHQKYWSEYKFHSIHSDELMTFSTEIDQLVSEVLDHD